MNQKPDARSQMSEIWRVVIKTIICCLLGVLLGLAMYWGWAREFAQPELAGPLTESRLLLLSVPSGPFPR